MAVIQDIIAALWQHDFAALADPHIVSVVYFVMFATLFLENGLLWVSVVTSFGYALSMIPFVKRHEDQVMTFLMILPIALLTAGLLGTLFVVIKKKYCNA